MTAIPWTAALLKLRGDAAISLIRPLQGSGVNGLTHKKLTFPTCLDQTSHGYSENN